MGVSHESNPSRTRCPRSGCRSRTTATSRPIRACWCRPTACTTRTSTATRCSTAPPACGASPAATTQPKIVAAVREMIGQLDFAPTFQMGHPAAFDLAEQLMEYTSHKFGHVFYTNSGSEAVDTALKMALAYHRARGEGAAHPPDRPRARLPRRRLRRHVGGRHRRQPQELRPAAAGRRPPAAHAQPRQRTPTRAASRNTARTWPTNSNASSPCTTPRTSPP